MSHEELASDVGSELKDRIFLKKAQSKDAQQEVTAAAVSHEQSQL